MQNQNVRGKKEVALFGKASRGTWHGSLVLLTEEGAKVARTEGGFQIKKGRGWQWEGAREVKEQSEGLSTLGAREKPLPSSVVGVRLGSACPRELGLCLPSLGYSCHCPLATVWHLQWVLIWGGKKFVELYFALIIISISITLLHRHLFIAWVRLYFLSLSCFCCWNPGHSTSMANSGLLERFPLSAWLESTPSPWAELSLLLRKLFCRADTARQVCPGMLPSSCASECMFGCHCNNLVMAKREDNQDFLQTQSYNTDSNVAAKFPFPCLKHLLPEKHLQNHCCILLLMTFRIMVFSDFCF